MDPDFYIEDHDDFEEEIGDEWSDNFFENSDDLFAPFDELDIDGALHPDQLKLGLLMPFRPAFPDKYFVRQLIPASLRLLVSLVEYQS